MGIWGADCLAFATISIVRDDSLACWDLVFELLTVHCDVVSPSRLGSVEPHKLVVEDGHSKFIRQCRLVELVRVVGTIL